MLRFTLLLHTLLFFFPLTLASAASQYHLDTTTRVSQCWFDCQFEVTNTINLPGTDTNSVTFITRNCEFDQFLNLMSLCLPQTCVSAPDAAYAVEYGVRQCARAGVKANITLPTEYVNAASAYFTSEAYTSKGTKGVSAWGMGVVILVLGPLVGLAL